jgi:hypothetical protein
MKLLEENIRKKFHDIRFCNNLLDLLHNGLKEKIDKLDLIPIFEVLCIKIHDKRMKK